MIHLVEVGPRDGLQNEPCAWSVEERIQFIHLLNPCGFKEIEVGSFVSPKWVPQMAHTGEVFQKIVKNPNIFYSCLVPNQQGFQAALTAGVNSISVFTAASQIFNQKNINCSIEESFERFAPLLQEAKRQRLRVRGYVSCVIECPYSGPIAPHTVAKVAVKLFKRGCTEISLGDTIGKGTPATITQMLNAVSQEVPMANLAIHCHDTYGNALMNIQAALAQGIQVIDSAMGGLGGCPYAGNQAAGNVATEKVVQLLNQLGFKTNINYEALQKVSAFVANKQRK